MMRATNHPKRSHTLPIFVLTLTVLLGLAAVAIDVGLSIGHSDHERKPRSLPVISDYPPTDPGKVDSDQGNLATKIALLVATCVIAFLLGLVTAMEIGRFN